MALGPNIFQRCLSCMSLRTLLSSETFTLLSQDENKSRKGDMKFI